MAATDTFEAVNASLSTRDRERLKDYIQQTRSDLLAARSEEARLRVVNEFLKEVRERQFPPGK